MAASGINRDEWLKALTEAGTNDHEDDQEAVTVNEFAALFDPPMNRQTASRRLLELERKGLAIRTHKRIGRMHNGYMANMLAYRLVKPAT